MGDYRGRIAPSPTGLLHLGYARTFWIAYQRTRAAGGKLILRIEDLDIQRCRQEYKDALIEDLRWLGVQWQEGPMLSSAHEGGPQAPFFQSERTELYRDAFTYLMETGWVYQCFCSRREVAQAARAPHENSGGDPDDEPIYPGTCRPTYFAPGRTNTATITHFIPVRGLPPPSYRFRVPDGEILRFQDGYQGEQHFMAGWDFGDFLVWSRGDVPSYQLAAVVDDAAMGITEVVRGADLLKSTARQMLLNRALGYRDPAWYHCDLVRDEQGRRMAKRHDALSLRALREAGMSPAAVLEKLGLKPL